MPIGEWWTSRPLFAPPVDDFAENIIELMMRPIIDEVADARQIGNTRTNVLETRRIGLGIRNMLDRQLGIYQCGDSFGQLSYRDRLVAAEIEHLSHGGRAAHQTQDAANDIRDMAEAAHLQAIVVNQEWAARQG